MATHHLPASSGDRTPAADTGTKTVGGLLRAAREARGLTLEQIASETKIQRRHLEALERDDLDALPAGLYLRGEIRAYARVVHLDEAIPLARLERVLQPPVEPAPPAEPAPVRTPLLTRQRVIVGAALIAITAIAGYMMRNRGPSALEAQQTAATDTAPQLSVQTVSHSIPSATVGTSLRAGDSTVARPGGQDAVPAAVTVPTQVEAPVSSPAAAQDPATRLVVTTQPPGARVTVNGIGWGTTPVTIRYLPPGDKRIRVSHDGYVAAERVVTVAEGQQRRVTITMRQSTP
jgi:cytoskeletal protein RodZ